MAFIDDIRLRQYNYKRSQEYSIITNLPLQVEQIKREILLEIENGKTEYHLTQPTNSRVPLAEIVYILQKEKGLNLQPNNDGSYTILW